jgi:hypothetical protein
MTVGPRSPSLGPICLRPFPIAMAVGEDAASRWSLLPCPLRTVRSTTEMPSEVSRFVSEVEPNRSRLLTRRAESPSTRSRWDRKTTKHRTAKQAWRLRHGGLLRSRVRSAVRCNQPTRLGHEFGCNQKRERSGTGPEDQNFHGLSLCSWLSMFAGGKPYSIVRLRRCVKALRLSTLKLYPKVQR